MFLMTRLVYCVVVVIIWLITILTHAGLLCHVFRKSSRSGFPDLSRRNSSLHHWDTFYVSFIWTHTIKSNTLLITTRNIHYNQWWGWLSEDIPFMLGLAYCTWLNDYFLLCISSKLPLIDSKLTTLCFIWFNSGCVGLFWKSSHKLTN